MKPSDVGLPYSNWSVGQEELVYRIVEAFARKDKVILEAPTGTGKSGVALAVANLLSDHTLVLTGTKQLQRQYAEMFDHELIQEVTGRANHPCIVEPVMADTAVCTVGQSCHLKNTSDCPYYAQFTKVNYWQIPVLNYPMWLTQVNYAHRFYDAKMIVCDEAHTMEDEIRRFTSVYLPHSFMADFGIPGIPPKTMEGWMSLARITQGVLFPKVRDIRRTPMGEVISDSERKERKRILSVYTGVSMLLSNGDPDAWVSIPFATGTQFRPVWVNSMARRYLWSHTNQVLMMSGTILSKEMFCENLGLDPEEAEFIRVPSNFPREQRPLRYLPVGRVKAADESTLRSLVVAVDNILDQHPEERGLIHTSSYKVAEYIREHSRHVAGRLLFHDAKSRIDALARFKLREGAVLVSPSMTTGVDLPYDLCRFQIIAKLSFPDLGDPQVKKRMKVGPDGNPNPKGQSWYNWMTACTLVQTYGRGMRAIDDECVTYMLDGNWDWFRHTVKGILPAWFTEAIIYDKPKVLDEDDWIAKIKEWTAGPDIATEATPV